MAILKNIGEMMRCYALFRGERLEQFDLIGVQSLYLRTICKNPGISQDELAEQLIFNKSSVARQLAAMEEKEFIRRERSLQDKRILLVYPTEKGIELLPEIHETVKSFVSFVTQDLTPEETVLLEELTKKLNLRAKEAIRNDEKTAHLQ